MALGELCYGALILKYLTAIHPVWLEPVATIRLNSRTDKTKLSEAIYLAEKYECIGIISNYANPMKAKFDRYENSGNIKGYDTPERLSTDELISCFDLVRYGVCKGHFCNFAAVCSFFRDPISK